MGGEKRKERRRGDSQVTVTAGRQALAWAWWRQAFAGGGMQVQGRHPGGAPPEKFDLVFLRTAGYEKCSAGRIY